MNKISFVNNLWINFIYWLYLWGNSKILNYFTFWLYIQKYVYLFHFIFFCESLKYKLFIFTIQNNKKFLEIKKNKYKKTIYTKRFKI